MLSVKTNPSYFIIIQVAQKGSKKELIPYFPINCLFNTTLFLTFAELLTTLLSHNGKDMEMVRKERQNYARHA